MEPNETEIRVRVETEITDEEHLIIDELKSLITRNETDEYLPFKKLDHRKLRDVTKKVNAVIRYIENRCCNSNKLVMAWKRRIENDITNLRRGIMRLERKRRGETGRYEQKI